MPEKNKFLNELRGVRRLMGSSKGRAVPEGEGVMTVTGSGPRTVHWVAGLCGVVVYVVAVAAHYFPLVVGGPVSWAYEIKILIPLTTGVFVIVALGVYSQQIRSVRIDGHGVEFIPAWARPTFVPWSNLEPPRYPPMMREVSFGERQGTRAQLHRGFWVSPNMAQAILLHPSCSKEGVSRGVLSFLGITERAS